MRRIGAAAAVVLLMLLAACREGGSTSPADEVTVYEGVPTIRDGDNVRIGCVASGASESPPANGNNPSGVQIFISAAGSGRRRPYKHLK